MSSLRAVRDRWEALLAIRTVEQITARRLSGDRCIGDVIAHLMAWQQISVARFEAARHGGEPVYPEWLGGADPFYAEEHVDVFNARIYDRYHQRPWPEVRRGWHETFQRLIALAETTPEDDLLAADRYPWLKGYPLAAVLEGSWDHHQHHYDDLVAQLG